MYEITLPGNPIALQRPRFVNGHVWNKQGDIRAEKSLMLKQLSKGIHPLEGPIGIDIDFYLKMPTSLSKKKHRELLNTYHEKRPDIDNYLKWIFDLCTGIFYLDDAQICYVSAVKVYSDDPRTEMQIFSVNEEQESWASR